MACSFGLLSVLEAFFVLSEWSPLASIVGGRVQDVCLKLIVAGFCMQCHNFEVLDVQDRTEAACINFSRTVCGRGPLYVPVNPLQLKLSVFTNTCFGWLGNLTIIQKLQNTWGG